MGNDVQKPSGDDLENEDTDERFQDHPELAPNESRVSVGKEDLNHQSIRRLADTGDIVEDTGDRGTPEMRFTEDDEFAGRERIAPTDSAYPGTPAGSLPSGASSSSGPDSGAEGEPAAAAEREADGPRVSFIPDPPSIPRHLQATVTQRFGRDVGAQGLSQEDLEGRDRTEGGPGRRTSDRRDWVAVLGKLGGSSPGSQENLALAGKFAFVQFPASRDAVLAGLHPVEDYFPLRESLGVDLRHAVSASRSDVFRTMNELIDCVKDELRRTEKPVT